MCCLICQEHWFPNQDNRKEEIIFSANQVQKIDRKVSCVAFPALAFSCLPAVIAGSMISCSLHQLHVFQPLTGVANFPALDAGHAFPALPYMFPVLYVAVYMFSRHLYYLRAFVLSNGFVFSFVSTSHMISLGNSDWLIYHYLRKFLCSFPLGPDQL